jgi:hypothetical protein
MTGGIEQRSRVAGFVLGLLLALGMAGCDGGDGGDGVATADGSGGRATSSGQPGGLSEQENALKFGRCMRDNGVPNFPDPKFNDGGGMSIDAPEGSDPQKIDAAMKPCKQYLPNGGEPAKLDPQRVEQLRRFARCMRENGLPSFPDPGPDGGIQMNSNDPDLNPQSPKFQAAQKACAKYEPARPSGDPGPGTETRSNG